LQAIEVKVAERFNELEDALKQMLSGPLASKAVLKYKACAKDIKATVEELTTDVRRLEECVGLIEASGFRASVEVVGSCTETVSSVATYLRDELTSEDDEGISAVDVQILIAKLQQVRGYADRALRALRTMVLPPPPPPKPPPSLHRGTTDRLRFSLVATRVSLSLFDGGVGRRSMARGISPQNEDVPDDEAQQDVEALKVAHGEAVQAGSELQRKLESTTEALQWLGSPPSEVGLKNVYVMLGDVVETCELLSKFKATAEERAPQADALNAQLLEDAEEDLRNRLCAKVDAALIAEASQALCITRSAVALVSVVADELRAYLERVEGVVEAMAESRKMGYRILHLVTQAKDYISNMSAAQVAKVQNEAVTLMLGPPLMALVSLQEGELQSVRSEFPALQAHLKKLSAALVPTLPPTPKSRTSSLSLLPPSPSSRNTKYKLRVHPEPESTLDPVHEMDLSEMNEAFEPPMSIHVNPPKK